MRTADLELEQRVYTADDSLFRLGMTLYQATNLGPAGGEVSWHVIEHKTSPDTHLLVSHPRPDGPVWVLYAKGNPQHNPIALVRNLFRSEGLAKGVAIDHLQDQIDDLHCKIDELRVRPADDICEGGRFRKRTGEMIYIRITQSSAKRFGLDVGAVWGVSELNGNLVRLEPEAVVVPAVSD